MELKEGMYVKLPIAKGKETRRFMGQITGFDSGIVFVKLFGNDNLLLEYGLDANKQFLEHYVSHCRILNNSVFVNRNSGKESRVLCHAGQDSRGLYTYYVKLFRDDKVDIVEVPEDTMEVPFTRVDMNVIDLVEEVEFSELSWWQKRYPLQNSLHILKSAAFGFDSLIGSRVFLHFHQVDTIIRAISTESCRFMLADEVGLGKTIEAGSIIKALKSKFQKLRTLIIVPESLINQWKTEMNLKFNLHFTIWDYRRVIGDMLFPLEKMDSKEGKNIIQNYNWDMCVIDETHRLLKPNNYAKYNRIADYSEKVKNILLLSATPIQQRQDEYQRLLSLLAPSRYKDMREKEFKELLNKQNYLRKKINPLIRDLSEYLEDELFEDYRDDLYEVSVKLNDPVLKELVGKIDHNATDQGLQAVRLALAYITENYQIEQRILRHRRAELATVLPARKLEAITYQRAGAEYGFFELETYVSLLEYLCNLQKANNDSAFFAGYARLLLTAMFSSPWALEDLLNRRKSTVLRALNKKYGRKAKVWKYKFDEIKTKTIHNVNMFHGEKDAIFGLLSLCKKWQVASTLELNSFKERIKSDQKLNGRLAKVLYYLYKQPSGQKYVVFSSYRETLEQLNEAINKVLNPHATSVIFCKGKNEKELQQVVDRFQEDPRCCYLLCDELGGEGRNFQIARAIIHVDIPWSPTALEQRIGRLDRIGRKDDVKSVVFYSQESIEEDLFNLWNEGLNIFLEPLSGLEVALDDVSNLLEKALHSDLYKGLQEVLGSVSIQLKKMKDMVERERHYDRARQLDRRLERQLRELAKCFDSEEDLAFSSVVDDWNQNIGLVYNDFIGGNKVLNFNSLIKGGVFLPENTLSNHHGTFSRQLAVSYDSLDFLGPGHPVFEALSASIEESIIGRFSGVEICGKVSADWEGMLFTWSVSPDLCSLFQKGIGLEKMVLARGYMPLHKIVTTLSFNEKRSEVRESEALDLLLGQENGFRRVSLERGFEKTEDWEQKVFGCYKRAYDKAVDKVRSLTDIEAARSDFYKQVEGRKAAALYFGGDRMESIRLEKSYVAILEALGKPKLRLDSMVYMRLVKESE